MLDIETVEEWLKEDILTSSGCKTVYSAFSQSRSDALLGVVVIDDLGIQNVQRNLFSMTELSLIAVDSKTGKKGVGRELYQQAVRDKPDILIGVSKNPQAMRSRGLALAELGYTTFVGLQEINGRKVSDQLRTMLEEIIKKYCAVTEVGNLSQAGIIDGVEGLLPGDIKFDKSFPAGIQSALYLLARYMSDVPNKICPVLPVISVRRELVTS